MPDCELYACNGKYPLLHAEDTPGCGTVFAAGTGLDDIHEEHRAFTVAASPEERANDIGDEQHGGTYTFKEYCPVCDEEDVVVVRADKPLEEVGAGPAP